MTQTQAVGCQDCWSPPGLRATQALSITPLGLNPRLEGKPLVPEPEESTFGVWEVYPSMDGGAVSDHRLYLSILSTGGGTKDMELTGQCSLWRLVQSLSLA